MNISKNNLPPQGAANPSGLRPRAVSKASISEPYNPHSTADGLPYPADLYIPARQAENEASELQEHHEDPFDEPPQAEDAEATPQANTPTSEAEKEVVDETPPPRPRPKMGGGRIIRSSEETSAPFAGLATPAPQMPIVRPLTTRGPRMIIEDMRVHSSPIAGDPGTFQVEMRYKTRIRPPAGAS